IFCQRCERNFRRMTASDLHNLPGLEAAYHVVVHFSVAAGECVIGKGIAVRCLVPGAVNLEKFLLKGKLLQLQQLFSRIEVNGRKMPCPLICIFIEVLSRNYKRSVKMMENRIYAHSYKKFVQKRIIMIWPFGQYP